MAVSFYGNLIRVSIASFADANYKAIEAGIEDIKNGRYEDYNVVFDRLEKKILNAMVK